VDFHCYCGKTPKDHRHQNRKMSLNLLDPDSSHQRVHRRQISKQSEA
jgi:hypothetical protein